MNAPLPSHALPLFEHRPLPKAMLDSLTARFAQRCSTARAVREQHGRDESPFEVTPPDAVVYAESTEDVAFVVKLASEYSVPVIPFGVGSSLEGHILAVQGGVSIDLSRMNKLVAVHPEDLTVTVQAGVTRTQLNREIKDTGLFFPIDPGADATLGGMAATRASGTNAVRYGTMRENVLALTVVAANGDIVRTGTRARKSSAGYDLTRLFVGSEGTLGVMTEVTVRLYPLPEAVLAAVCHFPDVGAAVNTTIQLIQLGVPIARCELLDANAVRAVNAHDKLNLLEQPMLLMEFHGSPAGVKEQSETVQEIARGFGGEQFQWATTPELDLGDFQNHRLRHRASSPALSLRPSLPHAWTFATDGVRPHAAGFSASAKNRCQFPPRILPASVSEKPWLTSPARMLPQSRLSRNQAGWAGSTGAPRPDPGGDLVHLPTRIHSMISLPCPWQRSDPIPIRSMPTLSASRAAISAKLSSGQSVPPLRW